LGVPPIKKILLIVGTVAVLLAAALAFNWVMICNRTAWAASRALSHALQNSRSVRLVEYVGDKTIAQKTAAPAEIARLREATTVWFCDFKPRGYLCCEPHHRVEIIRADRSQANFAVCFLCECFFLGDEPAREGVTSFYGPLPSAWEKSLASFFTSVGMTPKTDDEYGVIADTPGWRKTQEALKALVTQDHIELD
jgi:hypothetical protein